VYKIKQDGLLQGVAYFPGGWLTGLRIITNTQRINAFFTKALYSRLSRRNHHLIPLDFLSNFDLFTPILPQPNINLQNTTSHDTTSYDTTSYDTTSYDTTSYNTTSYDTTSYDTTSYDTTSYDTTSYNTTFYTCDGEEQAKAQRYNDVYWIILN
jgi:hypothetical protein